MLTPIFRLLFAIVWLATGVVYAHEQVFTYPFSDGKADLPPVISQSQTSGVRQFTVTNPSQKAETILLKIGNLPDSIRLYEVQNDQMVLLDQTGQLMARLPRPVESSSFIKDKELVAATIGPHQTITFRIYLTNQTRSFPKTFPIQLLTNAKYQATEALWFYDSERKQQLIEVFFWGIVSIMLLFTSLQYALLRETIFLYYALYLILIFIRVLLLGETIILDNWPGLRAVNFTGRYSLTALFWSLAAYSLFFRTFVELKIRSPRAEQITRWLSWGLLGLGILDIFVTIQRIYVPFWITTYQFIEISLVVFGVLHLWILWKCYDQMAKYIFWGVIMLVIGGVVSLINQQFPDVAGADNRDRLIWIVAYSSELLSFSIGLINRQLLLQQEKVRVQARLIEQLQENQRKQEQLYQLRSEIARDLHDELGSELSGISILSEVAIGRLSSQPALVKSTLTTIGETSRQVMDRMRDIVWNLSAHNLHTDNVDERLRTLTSNILEHTAIHSKLTIPSELPTSTLSLDQWRHLSMLYKEALHNVVKHSRATELVILLEIQGALAKLIIEDNGVGFLQHNKPTSNGLANLRDRAGFLNGQLTITSQPGNGTRICLKFPLRA